MLKWIFGQGLEFPSCFGWISGVGRGVDRVFNAIYRLVCLIVVLSFAVSALTSVLAFVVYPLLSK